MNARTSSALGRRTLLKTAAASAALAAPGAAVAQAQEAAPVRPARAKESERRVRAMGTGGLSQARLGRLRAAMSGHVERGQAAGIVTLVSRRGEVHVDAVGNKAVGANDPMRRDTIFRIASVTKPMTAVAAMILVEECKLRLDDPFDRWLPELANRKVLRAVDGPLDDTVPASRPITVRDLLAFRLGYGAVMVFPPRYPIQKAMEEAGSRLAPICRR
jgi:CubicO group peptidase (beta-lactamase class C family)